jgi:hypothetical protein
MKVYPVIHHLNHETSLNEVRVAKTNGADGVFLISHHGDDKEMLNTAWEAKQMFQDFSIGINLLSKSASEAAMSAYNLGLNMVWADQMGVSSQGLNSVGKYMQHFGEEYPSIELFASVAFKYQAVEPDPVEAAIVAFKAGMIPTTSGDRTGHAPDIKKIRNMHFATELLGIASGMTPENIVQYARFLTHCLVATGISLDEFRMDPKKLRKLIINSNPGFSNGWYDALPEEIQRERKSMFALDVEQELELLCIEEMRKQNV